MAWQPAVVAALVYPFRGTRLEALRAPPVTSGRGWQMPGRAVGGLVWPTMGGYATGRNFLYLGAKRRPGHKDAPGCQIGPTGRATVAQPGPGDPAQWLGWVH
ncbi:hypothetical protein CJ030_MR7G018879 [Morella rubra]|uniref:Uncharacterized protein n=1 Tax=Morella rubra TaxID=262757 RepID=A0A6A1V106_9ROSI|nr:hypothetical protein CJ030_MR7G018879 [Morella rubra]